MQLTGLDEQVTRTWVMGGRGAVLEQTHRWVPHSSDKLHSDAFIYVEEIGKTMMSVLRY